MQYYLKIEMRPAMVANTYNSSYTEDGRSGLWFYASPGKKLARSHLDQAGRGGAHPWSQLVGGICRRVSVQVGPRQKQDTLSEKQLKQRAKW
jgi:hypothetical protein